MVHRFIGEADLKIRAARALMHERYAELYAKVLAGKLPEAADIADVGRSPSTPPICRLDGHARPIISPAIRLHHPHVLGRLLRDVNAAGLHQVMSDTAYENHGKFRLGLPADPLA